MKKIKIHTELIKKQGAKLQFQIKLPDTTKMVTGILITINPIGLRLPPQEGEIPPKDQLEAERGWIWLRIPEKRDVFFADTVKFPNHKKVEFHGVNQMGLAEKPEWWFSGTRRDFFSVTVPIENTIIEGFYVDKSTESTVDYQLKIYLELEID